MTVRVYRSSDAGAPSLSGQQGTMINVLSAVLTGPSFNGTGFAYGTTPCAGWSRPFIGTNIAAYQQPATANQRFLLVDDSVADQYSRLTGYETMTSISVGTNPFPTPSQIANSKLFVVRSNTFDATVRGWTIIASDKLFYMFINGNSQSTITGTAPGNAGGFCFGDFISNQPGDIYNTIIIAVQTNSTVNCSTLHFLGNLSNAPLVGHYVNRSYTQIGGSTPILKAGDWTRSPSGSMGTSGLTVPNASDGNIYVAPITIYEFPNLGSVFRGTMPGLYTPLHNMLSVLNEGDQISGINGLPGKTLEAHFQYNNNGSPSVGVGLVEISDTWYV